MKLIIIKEEQKFKDKDMEFSQTLEIPPEIQNPSYEKIPQISAKDITFILQKHGYDIAKIKKAIMKIIQQMQKAQK